MRLEQDRLGDKTRAAVIGEIGVPFPVLLFKPAAAEAPAHAADEPELLKFEIARLRQAVERKDRRDIVAERVERVINEDRRAGSVDDHIAIGVKLLDGARNVGEDLLVGADRKGLAIEVKRLEIELVAGSEPVEIDFAAGHKRKAFEIADEVAVTAFILIVVGVKIGKIIPARDAAVRGGLKREIANASRRRRQAVTGRKIRNADIRLPRRDEEACVKDAWRVAR